MVEKLRKSDLTSTFNIIHNKKVQRKDYDNIFCPTYWKVITNTPV